MDWSKPVTENMGPAGFIALFGVFGLCLMFGFGWLYRPKGADAEPAVGEFAQAPAKEEGEWQDYAIMVLMLPCRLIGVSMLFVITGPGLIAVWNLPSQARSLGV